MTWAHALGLAVAALTLSPSAVADCADPFADPDDIVTLTLRMTPADWDTVRLGEPVGAGCDAQHAYVTAQLSCGDELPIPIGVRRKRGDQRGRDTDDKPPLKLDINRIVDGQRWPTALGKRGYRKLSLNNGQADNPGGLQSVIATEHFALRLMFRELGVAPRVAYARVVIELSDGTSAPVVREPHGLYILIEDIDRSALRARFDDADGLLLKTTTTVCRDEVVFEDEDDGENEATVAWESWAAEDPHTYAPGAWRERTERALALDDLLRQEALRDVLGNRADTPLGNGSNHFAFDPKRGRRHYIPWDLDDALRPDVAPDEPLSPACSFLGERTRCHPDIERRYLEIVCQLVQGMLAPDALADEWRAIDAVIRPTVAQEKDTVWRGRDPLDARTPRTYASEYERVLQFFEPRIAAVRAQLEERGVSCDARCTDGTVEPCMRLGCAGVRACLDGRMSACTPLVDERCNGVDDDCDLAIDEDGACTTPRTAAHAPPPGAPPAVRRDDDAACACARASSALPASALALLSAGPLLRRRASRRRT